MRDYIIEAAKLQTDYNKLVKTKKLSKKALCDLCVPFRNRYNLSDLQTLKIARSEVTLSEILSMFNPPETTQSGAEESTKYDAPLECKVDKLTPVYDFKQELCAAERYLDRACNVYSVFCNSVIVLYEYIEKILGKPLDAIQFESSMDWNLDEVLESYIKNEDYSKEKILKVIEEKLKQNVSSNNS